jgi:hypothetical protein
MFFGSKLSMSRSLTVEPAVTTADEAIVFFAFLSRFQESDALTIVDQAEESALTNLRSLAKATCQGLTDTSGTAIEYTEPLN